MILWFHSVELAISERKMYLHIRVTVNHVVGYITGTKLLN